MPFEFQLSDELKVTIKTIAKKDQKMTEAINKKIKQIIYSDDFTIDHYKNLKYEMNDYKRVHIMKHFVLLFKVFKEKNFILFDKFGHHNNIYKRKK
ncbi:MAG: addiction module toxin RelE [Candidatus ainarchaeum sp.]|nr:addiction module toxin RelE [Candidatus ainarchaeum sp.]